jgi:DNA adenine methylase
MFPNDAIETTANKHGWGIHRIERIITAARASVRRKQEEWIVINYNIENQ